VGACDGGKLEIKQAGEGVVPQFENSAPNMIDRSGAYGGDNFKLRHHRGLAALVWRV
jgi:hypothetical protein